MRSLAIVYLAAAISSFGFKVEAQECFVNIGEFRFSCEAHTGQLVPIYADAQAAFAAAALGGARVDCSPLYGYQMALRHILNWEATFALSYWKSGEQFMKRTELKLGPVGIRDSHLV